MTRQRRQFDISLKLEVVRMIKEQRLTTTPISQKNAHSKVGKIYINLGRHRGDKQTITI